jgi:hypothetical protein
MIVLAIAVAIFVMILPQDQAFRPGAFGTLASSQILVKKSHLGRELNMLVRDEANKQTHVAVYGSNNPIAEEDKPLERVSLSKKILFLSLWAGFIGYAFFLSPGGTPEGSARDFELIKKLIYTPYDGTTNAIFVAIFNILGIIPFVFAALFIPGAKTQKLPPALFSTLMMAMGYGAAGPYLAFRKINTTVTKSNQGRGSFIFEFNPIWILALGWASYLFYYMISQMLSLGVGEVVSDYFQLCSSSRLVIASSIDLAILSTVIVDPIAEDIQRRTSSSSSSFSVLPAWSYASVPVLGPIFYLLTRPKLPQE